MECDVLELDTSGKRTRWGNCLRPVRHFWKFEGEVHSYCEYHNKQIQETQQLPSKWDRSIEISEDEYLVVKVMES